MRVIKLIWNGIHVIQKRLYCKLNSIKYAKVLGVKVGNGTVFYGPRAEMFSTEPWLITIGRNCHITAGVTFCTHDGGTLSVRNKCGPFVIVGNIIYIGIKNLTLPSVHIGDNAIIGAGSIVTKDIPDNCVATGLPCRVIESRDKYIDKVNRVRAGLDDRYYSDLDYMHSLNPNDH